MVLGSPHYERLPDGYVHDDNLADGTINWFDFTDDEGRVIADNVPHYSDNSYRQYQLPPPNFIDQEPAASGKPGQC